MKLNSPYLLTVNDQITIIIPDGSKFPYTKIKADYIICSEKHWKDNKVIIKKHLIKKPKVIFLNPPLDNSKIK